MHPIFFIGTTFVSLLIIILSFTVSNIYYLPVNISFNNLIDPIKKQIECLAENIYFEARNESDNGKIAVALVTMNRVATGNYANTVCDVVYQRTKTIDNKIVCQFSWTCQAKEMSERLTIRKTSLYNDIRNMSIRVYMNYDKIQDITNGATYYHADYVSPGWGLPISVKIGRHIFYTEKTDLNNLYKRI